jgi:hypothetical protein
VTTFKNLLEKKYHNHHKLDNIFGVKPGYNDKNIMFPTTILDMGPRDSYISEICNDPNFKGYMADQFRSTSYNENGDIIQIGFLSRILNENFRQALIPISRWIK